MNAIKTLDDAVCFVTQRNAAYGDPATSLAAIGMKADGIDKAAELATRNPYWNPRPIDRDSIRRLIDDAFHGRAPQPAGR